MTADEEPGGVKWLNLDKAASVTVVAGGRRMPRATGLWSAACTGEQVIEIRFRRPTSLRYLRVTSSESSCERTQEMTVWASLHRGEQHREVLRQQFNFSPRGAVTEIEQYALRLDDVSQLVLRITPSIEGASAVARVDDLRIAEADAEQAAKIAAAGGNAHKKRRDLKRLPGRR